MYLIYKGAEAELYTTKYLGLPAVLKIRVPKKYKLKQIDDKLRLQRTRMEVYNILRASQFIATPAIFDVNLESCAITMQFIDGEKVKDYLFHASENQIKDISGKIADSVSKMHANDMIHGDLTTSNMILKDGKVYFIDFGLAQFTTRDEDKAVDLSVFKKMLLSTHYKNFDLIWNSFLKQYKNQKILKRLNEVEKRVRYAEK